MQTITVTEAYVNECAYDVLCNIATEYCKVDKDKVEDIAVKKLRQTVVKFLQGKDNGYDEAFAKGELQLDIAVLPDIIATAGSNKSQGQRRATAKLEGHYKVVNKNGCKADAGSAKHKVYAILFDNDNFATYLQKCKEAGLEAVVVEGKKNKQLKITASEFARWALKCKWILPVDKAAEQQEGQPTPNAEQQQSTPAAQ